MQYHFYFSVETFDENGQKVAFNQHVDFMVGAGHFGGKKTSDTIVPVVNPPNRNPDTFMEEKTMKDQVRIFKNISICSTRKKNRA